ncbi:MAG TPA: NAD(P)H-hydrate epimerase, partial [Anaeromyxobacter sp.]|nr:NAD(P)H-hydrate epimerase [Anaeromyxobacter sp.]
MRLVGSAEMREIDRVAIEGFGIPSLTLMDRAGRAVAEAAVQLAAPQGRFVVVCGAGNNGGDGYVAARLLRSAGRDARVLALVSAERLSADARAVREQAQRAGVALDDVGELAAVDAGVGDVVLDAIFGTGLARPPAGAFAGAISRIEAARVAGARVLAVDVPSGLSADNGRPLG